MRKWFIILALLLVLLAPATVQAQTENLSIDTLGVQIWPEYDRPDALVIYDFTISQDTPLPATITLRIPADADLIAVASLEGGAFLNVPYAPPTSDGQWLLFSFEITSQTSYRIEYYAPISKSGTTRQFIYEWTGDYAVRAFSINVQEPVDATALQTDPIATTPFPGNDGFTYYRTDPNEIPAGQAFRFTVRYDKSTDTLSAQSLEVQPSGGTLTPEQITNWGTYLPWILGGIGLALIVGGGIWYWQTGRAESTPKQRKRHANSVIGNLDSDDGSNPVYCHQCGKRAQPSDRFCRACGIKLRRE